MIEPSFCFFNSLSFNLEEFRQINQQCSSIGLIIINHLVKVDIELVNFTAALVFAPFIIT